MAESRKLEIVYRPLSEIRPYAKNARTHTPHQIAKLKKSLAKYGWTNPMLIADGELIAGHARLDAAIEMAAEGQPIRGNPDPMMGPTVDLSHLSAAERRAYILADNRMALDAGWDDELLRAELSALTDLDFDLSLTGFDDTELAGLLADPPAGLTDPDEAPEPPQTPVSRRGDVWILGRHRLVCGDATDASDVALALNGVQPHLMVTDPPYGVDYNPEWRAEAGVNKNRGKMGAVENDSRADWSEAWALSPADVAYVWHAGVHAAEVAGSLERSQYGIRSQIIWAKDRFALSRGNYHWQHEPCWYAVRNTAHWAGDRSQSTLWQIPARDDSGHGHGTQKPVECMKRPIENNSSPGQAVYEPFSGSGTTIIAAEMTARVCHAIEIAPQYVDVAIIRWQDFVGKQATLESTGQTYEEVAAERLSEPPPASEPLELASQPL
jgi:DNA modification methylase